MLMNLFKTGSVCFPSYETCTFVFRIHFKKYKVCPHFQMIMNARADHMTAVRTPRATTRTEASHARVTLDIAGTALHAKVYNTQYISRPIDKRQSDCY